MRTPEVPEAEEARLFLTRPDSYVEFRCRLADAARLQTHLDSIFVGAI